MRYALYIMIQKTFILQVDRVPGSRSALNVPTVSIKNRYVSTVLTKIQYDLNATSLFDRAQPSSFERYVSKELDRSQVFFNSQTTMIILFNLHKLCFLGTIV